MKENVNDEFLANSQCVIRQSSFSPNCFMPKMPFPYISYLYWGTKFEDNRTNCGKMLNEGVFDF